MVVKLPLTFLTNSPELAKQSFQSLSKLSSNQSLFFFIFATPYLLFYQLRADEIDYLCQSCFIICPIFSPSVSSLLRTSFSIASISSWLYPLLETTFALSFSKMSISVDPLPQSFSSVLRLLKVEKHWLRLPRQLFHLCTSATIEIHFSCPSWGSFSGGFPT